MKRVIISLIICLSLVAVLLCGFFIFRDVYLTYQAQIEEQPSEEPAEPGGEEPDEPSEEPEEPDNPFFQLLNFYTGYTYMSQNEEGVFDESIVLDGLVGSSNVSGPLISYFLTEDNKLTPFLTQYSIGVIDGGTFSTGVTGIAKSFLTNSYPTYTITGVEKISSGFKLNNDEGADIVVYMPMFDKDYNFKFKFFNQGNLLETIEKDPLRVLVIDGEVYADLGYKWEDVEIPTVPYEILTSMDGTYYHCNRENGVYVKDTASFSVVYVIEDKTLKSRNLTMMGTVNPFGNNYPFSYTDIAQTAENKLTCQVADFGFGSFDFYLTIPFEFEETPSKILMVNGDVYACFD